MPATAQSVVILGTGSYTPKRVVTNAALAEMVDTSDEWIRTRTGIRERRFACAKETTSHMACAAATKALEASKLDRDKIDLIIVATMTPDMPFPSTACLVQSQMNLPKTMAFDLQAACSGFVYALSVASNMLESGKFNNALVIGAEKTSGILDFEDRTTCVLFGDGAGAAVLSRNSKNSVGIISSLSGSDGSNPKFLHQPAGGSAIPASSESLLNRQHFLKMNGQEIFKQAVRVMTQSSQDILEQCGYKSTDLDLVIPHQANMRIIESVAKRLGTPMEKFYNNLEFYGNTSAASVGIALDEAFRKGRIQSGDLILLVAFGAGLTWASTLIKWQ